MKVIIILILCLILININGYSIAKYINNIYEYICEEELKKDIFGTENIEWCTLLRKNWKNIRKEYINYCKKNHKLKDLKKLILTKKIMI